jgi:hypothetical protein
MEEKSSGRSGIRATAVSGGALSASRVPTCVESVGAFYWPEGGSRAAGAAARAASGGALQSQRLSSAARRDEAPHIQCRQTVIRTSSYAILSPRVWTCLLLTPLLPAIVQTRASRPNTQPGELLVGKHLIAYEEFPAEYSRTRART